MTDTDKTPIDLDECDRIHAAMTPEPWRIDEAVVPPDLSLYQASIVIVGDETRIADMLDAHDPDVAHDARGIVYQHNHWPALLADLRAARERIAEWEEAGRRAVANHDPMPARSVILPHDITIVSGAVKSANARLRERIATLEARERELVAALDEALDLVRGSLDLQECVEGPDKDSRIRLDRLRAIAHPERQGEAGQIARSPEGPRAVSPP